jgi:hypothetical protein
LKETSRSKALFVLVSRNQCSSVVKVDFVVQVALLLVIATVKETLRFKHRVHREHKQMTLCAWNTRADCLTSIQRVHVAVRSSTKQAFNQYTDKSLRSPWTSAPHSDAGMSPHRWSSQTQAHVSNKTQTNKRLTSVVPVTLNVPTVMV